MKKPGRIRVVYLPGLPSLFAGPGATAHEERAGACTDDTAPAARAEAAVFDEASPNSPETNVQRFARAPSRGTPVKNKAD